LFINECLNFLCRFFGRISATPEDHEEDNIVAISKNVSGLERISGERLWSEIRKILSGKYPAALMLKMLEVGIGKYIGLPENFNVNEFNAVMARASQSKIELHPITMLSAFLSNDSEVYCSC